MNKTTEIRRPVPNEQAVHDRIVDAARLARTCQLAHRSLPRPGFDKGFPAGDAFTLPRFPDPAVLERRDRYSLKDFLDFHDEEFIRNVYLGVLQRPVDPSGLAHYLDALRQVRMTKAEVLGDIRYSREGRAANVQVDGLRIAYTLRLLGKVPLVGYLLRLGRTLACLPILMRQHEEFQRFVMAEFTGRDNFTRQSAGAVEAALRQLDRLLAEKADANEIREFRSELLNRIEAQGEHAAATYATQHELEVTRRTSRQEPDRFQGESLEPADDAFSALYSAFEEKFRGDRQEVMKDQADYLPYLRETKVADPSAKVVDIGSGRGEWLELLQREGIRACGVDINARQVEACKSRGLDVAHGDALNYLRQQASGSVRAVTGYQIIEHLPLPLLIEVIAESYRVLHDGGVAIFETPNPGNVFVGSCSFHYDPTHHKPIPSPLLKFLLEYHGFSDVRIVEMHRSTSQAVKEVREVDRHFNRFFYGPMDYAAVAFRRKPA